MRQVLGIPGHPKVINQNPCKHPGISKRLQGTVQQMETFDALTKGLRILLKRHKVNIFSRAPTYALHSMVPDRVFLPKLSVLRSPQDALPITCASWNFSLTETPAIARNSSFSGLSGNSHRIFLNYSIDSWLALSNFLL